MLGIGISCALIVAAYWLGKFRAGIPLAKRVVALTKDNEALRKSLPLSRIPVSSSIAKLPTMYDFKPGAPDFEYQVEVLREKLSAAEELLEFWRKTNVNSKYF